MGKYVIRASSDGYYFIIVTENGQVILTSVMYQTMVDCKSGIAQAKANCYLDNRYDFKKATDCEFFFMLRTSNGQIIGISEMYDNVRGIQNGIASVKKNGLSDHIIEE